jgi:multidrug efflux pump subunit AcrB
VFVLAAVALNCSGGAKSAEAEGPGAIPVKLAVAQSVAIDDTSVITDTLGVYMGSSYVNDFDFNNRSYRVYVQADQRFRAESKNMKQYYVRSDSGAMVPLDNLVTITQTTTPQVISHYNLFRSAEIDGSAAPGYSSGHAIDAMEEMSRKSLPQGSTTSGPAYRSRNCNRVRRRCCCSGWARWWYI